MLSGEELARAVLKAKDRYALLSLGSDVPIAVSAEGYLNLEDEDIRRCYTKIAARIHPDKLTSYSEATKAFQALVRAYELCCKPDLRADDSDDSRDEDGDEDEDEEDDSSGEDDDKEEDEEESDDDDGEKYEDDDDKPLIHRQVLAKVPAAAPSKAAGKASSKAAAKAASKAAAKAPKTERASAKPSPKPRKAPKSKTPKAKGSSYRTGVRCPRCHAEWGAHLKSEGREYTYTLFMRGQQQVHCLTCLFEFGCLTAAHHCPCCARPFEYRPDQFHRTLTCPNGKARGKAACGVRFRVMQFGMSKSQQAAFKPHRWVEKAV